MPNNLTAYPYAGKFENEPAVLAYLYEYVLNGAEDEVGSCDDTGWIAWRLNSVSLADFCHGASHVAERCGITLEQLHDDIAELEASGPVVIVEDSHGFCYMSIGADAERVWKARCSEVEAFYASQA